MTDKKSKDIKSNKPSGSFPPIYLAEKKKKETIRSFGNIKTVNITNIVNQGKEEMFI